MKIRVPLINCILLVLLFSSSSINAQITLADHKAVIARFENFYNKGQFDSVYSMYSTDMKNTVSRGNANMYLSNLRMDAGAIVTKDLEKSESDCAVYKAKFENSLFSIFMCIDTQGKLIGYNIRPYVPDTLPIMARNITPMQLPFNGAWTVLWGGDNKGSNHHIGVQAQKSAFDIIIKNRNGKSYKNDGKNNEDYYAYGQKIIAPCDGEVVLAVDGIKDNIPGERNTVFATGNVIIIKTKNNEYLVFMHFKPHTIKVRQGQKIKLGTLLGLCGNSGNSTEPHLHFHIENIEDMELATGVKCYFEKILVDGAIKTDYSPRKEDRIENIKK